MTVDASRIGAGLIVLSVPWAALFWVLFGGVGIAAGFAMLTFGVLLIAAFGDGGAE